MSDFKNPRAVTMDDGGTGIIDGGVAKHVKKQDPNVMVIVGLPDGERIWSRCDELQFLEVSE